MPMRLYSSIATPTSLGLLVSDTNPTSGNPVAVTTPNMPWVSALQYGVLADNVHDDTAALQAAINAAMVTKSGVLLPHTGFAPRISAPIWINPASGFANLNLRAPLGTGLTWTGGSCITGTIASLSASGTNPTVLTMSAPPHPTPVVGTVISLSGGSKVLGGPWTIVSVSGSTITLSGAVTYTTAPTTAAWYGTIASITGGSGGTVVNLDTAPASAPTVGMLVDLTGGTGVTGGPWTIAAVSGTQITLSAPVTYTTPPTGIQWNGAFFASRNWKGSTIEGMRLNANGAAGVIGFDLDATDSQQSTSDLSFRNCQMFAGSGGFCVMYRAAHSYRTLQTTFSDISFLNFENSKLQGGSTSDIHFSMEGPNALCWQVFGGATITAGQVLSSYGGPGSVPGGGSIFFFGHGTSGNAGPDFDFEDMNSFALYGGRFEDGNTLVRVGEGGGTFPVNVVIDGIEVGGYNPANGRLFDFQTAAVASLKQAHIYRFTGGAFAYDARLINLAGAGNYGVLTVENCQIQGNAATGFYTQQGGCAWAVNAKNNVVQNDGSASTGYFSSLETATTLQSITPLLELVPGPAIQGYTAWTCDPVLAAGNFAPTAGQVIAAKLMAPYAFTINSLDLLIAVAGTGATALANCYVGLVDSSGNRQFVSADQSANWATAGNKTISLGGSPFTVTPNTFLYVVLLVGTQSTTAVNIAAINANNNGAGTLGMSAGAYRCAVLTTGVSTIASSFTLSNQVANNRLVFFGIK